MPKKQGPTLIIMAAGLGSRFGALKQVLPVGPTGETIIDYSVFDAIRAGFRKVVFVIREEIETEFREMVGRRLEDQVSVEYAFQKQPQISVRRTKPWGTAHALLCAEESVSGPFAIINADDFYGRRSFFLLGSFLQMNSDSAAMVGFNLRETLSDFGEVKRGVCSVSAKGHLIEVDEAEGLHREASGPIVGTLSGVLKSFSGDEIVSMNMWGFSFSVFTELRKQWAAFLSSHESSETAEFYIPDVVTSLINVHDLRCQVIPTSDSWFGVTYSADAERVRGHIIDLIKLDEYPAALWGS